MTGRDPCFKRTEDEVLHDTTVTGPVNGPGSFDAALLDLFGTLVDFRSVFVGTLRRILVENGLIGQEDEFRGRWQSFVFQGAAEGAFVTVREDFIDSLVRVLGDLGVEGDLRGYSDDVIGSMFEDLRRARLFPEVPEVIEGLDAAGVPWAVVSNVDEDDLRTIMTNHGLRPVVSVSSERVRSYKPHAGPFIAALEELDLPAERVIHAGDSPLADVKGAADLGMGTYWVNRYDMEYPGDLPEPGWTARDLRVLPSLFR